MKIMYPISSVLLLLSFLFATQVRAQDTLWVKKIGGKPYVVHQVSSGEDIFMLSKRYSVPPAALADANNLNYQTGLDKGTKIWIPVDNYNFIRIESVIKSRPIYYKVMPGEDLGDVGKIIHVAQSSIQRWNNLSLPEIKAGQPLQVGWIAFDATQVPFATQKKMVTQAPAKTNPQSVNTSNAPAVAKTQVKKDSVTTSLSDTAEAYSAYKSLYDQQVAGQPSGNESGAAVFYPLKIKAPEGVYYAFHNTAAKGTIIKVSNPSNGRSIYAKVIGTIPNIVEYHNSIIALSTNAAKGLIAKEKRMFCKIEYK
jgi:LysM repeat protein